MMMGEEGENVFKKEEGHLIFNIDMTRRQKNPLLSKNNMSTSCRTPE
jgi:hypothetical protein